MAFADVNRVDDFLGRDVGYDKAAVYRGEIAIITDHDPIMYTDCFVDSGDVYSFDGGVYCNRILLGAACYPVLSIMKENEIGMARMRACAMNFAVVNIWRESVP